MKLILLALFLAQDSGTSEPATDAISVLAERLVHEHQDPRDVEATIRLNIAIMASDGYTPIALMTLTSDAMECVADSCELRWTARLHRPGLPDNLGAIEHAPTSPLRPNLAAESIRAAMVENPEGSPDQWLEGVVMDALETDYSACGAATRFLARIDETAWISEPGRRSLALEATEPRSEPAIVVEGIPTEDASLPVTGSTTIELDSTTAHLMNTAFYGAGMLHVQIHLKLPWTRTSMEGPARADLATGWAVQLLYELEPCWQPRP